MADAAIPTSLQINAWTGGPVVSPLAATWTSWATASRRVPPGPIRAAAEPVDDRDWFDPRVGWGLVVADNDRVPVSDRAAGADLPEGLRRLVESRKGPILRYRDDLGVEFLRRHYTDGSAQDLATVGSKAGTARGQLPMYLLIWGSPARHAPVPCVPWSMQYALNGSRYVGRLHLEEPALGRYVAALMEDWKDSAVRADEPVVWAVDHAPDDITHIMRLLVAEPVVKRLREDVQVGARTRYLSGSGATIDALVNALSDPGHVPAFILSTSHGMTAPLADVPAMSAALGLPVDRDGRVLQPADLITEWAPCGAIWYAHACCSAGSDDVTQYGELVPDGSIKDVLTGVAAIGASVAPLPTALLSATRPVRAFIGHVEPTFDWTLRHPDNQQPLAGSINQALYDGMYRARPEPVGLAFKRTYAQAGQLFGQFQQARQASSVADPVTRNRAQATALRAQLGALDRQACVILGDPTVALPQLG